MQISSKPKRLILPLVAFIACTLFAQQTVQAQRFRVGTFGGPLVVPVAPSFRPAFAPMPMLPPVPRFFAERSFSRGPVFLPPPISPIGLSPIRGIMTPPVMPVAPFVAATVPARPVFQTPIGLPSYSVASPIAAPFVQVEVVADPTGFRFQSQVAQPVQMPIAGLPIDSISAEPIQGANDLVAAATELQTSLSRMQGDEAEVWTEYLAPRQVADAFRTGDTATLAQLLQHYDGVAGNHSLDEIASANGFAATRSLMRQAVGTVENPRTDSVTSEVVAPKPSTAPRPATSATDYGKSLISPEPTTKSADSSADDEVKMLDLPAPLPEPDTKPQTGEAVQ